MAKRCPVSIGIYFRLPFFSLAAWIIQQAGMCRNYSTAVDETKLQGWTAGEPLTLRGWRINLIIDTRVYVDQGYRDVSILWSSITQEYQLGEVSAFSFYTLGFLTWLLMFASLWQLPDLHHHQGQPGVKSCERSVYKVHLLSISDPLTLVKWLDMWECNTSWLKCIMQYISGEL